MNVYLLTHIQDCENYGVDVDIFLTKEDAQKAMRTAWADYLKVLGINVNDEQCDEKNWECNGNMASIHDESREDFECWEIQEKTLDVKVAVKVRGGMVQSIIANTYVDADVYDLDVSDFPDDGEEDEAMLREKEFDELYKTPGWREIW